MHGTWSYEAPHTMVRSMLKTFCLWHPCGWMLSSTNCAIEVCHTSMKPMFGCDTNMSLRISVCLLAIQSLPRTHRSQSSCFLVVGLLKITLDLGLREYNLSAPSMAALTSFSKYVSGRWAKCGPKPIRTTASMSAGMLSNSIEAGRIVCTSVHCRWCIGTSWNSKRKVMLCLISCFTLILLTPIFI